MAGYAIAPGAMNLSTFLWAGLGTGLCSSSANAFNQVCIFDCKCLEKKNFFFSSVQVVVVLCHPILIFLFSYIDSKSDEICLIVF